MRRQLNPGSQCERGTQEHGKKSECFVQSIGFCLPHHHSQNVMACHGTDNRPLHLNNYEAENNSYVNSMTNFKIRIPITKPHYNAINKD